MLNYFDIIVLTTALAGNFIAWRYLKPVRLHGLVVLLIIALFIFVLPYFSNEVEFQKARAEYPNGEGWNFAYIAFRAPVWWLLGLGEILFLYFLARGNRRYASDPNQ